MLDYTSGYVLALFSLAKETNKLTKYKENSVDLIHAFSHNLEYIKIMDDRGANLEFKQMLISQAFQDKIDQNMVNFIKLLVDRSKTRLLIPILTKLIKIINKKLHINEGIVYTVNKIIPSEIKKIEQSISQKLGHKISLQNKIDRELISGVKVVVDDEFIEDTVLSRLKQIKHKLLNKEEKTHVS